MKKILIVDDNISVRELIEATLSGDDYQVLQAKSGLEAVDVIKAEKPELVIMDVMMPGEIDGFEATRILKSDLQTKDCKIIMLTAKTQTADLDKGFEVGADGYFTKPFSPLELIKKIEEVIG